MEISTKINLCLAQAVVGYIVDVVFYVHLGQCANIEGGYFCLLHQRNASNKGWAVVDLAPTVLNPEKDTTLHKSIRGKSIGPRSRFKMHDARCSHPRFFRVVKNVARKREGG